MFLYFTINTESVFTEVFFSLSVRSDSHPYVSSLVCAFFMCLTPLWMVISSKHPASRQLLYSGWEARYYCHVHQQVRYTHTHTWPRIRTHTEKACGPTFAPPTQYMSLFQYWRTHPGQNWCLIPTWLGLWFTRLLSMVRFVILYKNIL